MADNDDPNFIEKLFDETVYDLQNFQKWSACQITFKVGGTAVGAWAGLGGGVVGISVGAIIGFLIGSRLATSYCGSTPRTSANAAATGEAHSLRFITESELAAFRQKLSSHVQLSKQEALTLAALVFQADRNNVSGGGANGTPTEIRQGLEHMLENIRTA